MPFAKSFAQTLVIIAALAIHLRANAEGAKGGGGSSVGLFGDFVLKKERSLVELKGGISLLREEGRPPDPVLDLGINLALTRYVSLEASAGGYHEHLPYWVWNDFLSYIVAGLAYGFSSLSGENPSFQKLRDPLIFEVRNKEHPYKNFSVSSGLFFTPFPALVWQPVLGVQVTSISYVNKGSAHESHRAARPMVAVGFDRRSNTSTSSDGFQVFFSSQEGQLVVEGVKYSMGVGL